MPFVMWVAEGAYEFNNVHLEVTGDATPGSLTSADQHFLAHENETSNLSGSSTKPS